MSTKIIDLDSFTKIINLIEQNINSFKDASSFKLDEISKKLNRNES